MEAKKTVVVAAAVYLKLLEDLIRFERKTMKYQVNTEGNTPVMVFECLERSENNQTDRRQDIKTATMIIRLHIIFLANKWNICNSTETRQIHNSYTTHKKGYSMTNKEFSEW